MIPAFLNAIVFDSKEPEIGVPVNTQQDTLASPSNKPASTNGRNSRSRAGASPPPSRRRQVAEPQRISSRTGARVVSYAEDDEDDEDGGVDRSQKVQEPIAAFDDPGATQEEVEKVVGHRWG